MTEGVSDQAGEWERTKGRTHPRTLAALELRRPLLELGNLLVGPQRLVRLLCRLALGHASRLALDLGLLLRLGLVGGLRLDDGLGRRSLLVLLFRLVVVAVLFRLLFVVVFDSVGVVGGRVSPCRLEVESLDERPQVLEQASLHVRAQVTPVSLAQPHAHRD